MQTSDDLPYKFPDGSYMRKPQRHDDGHASADSAFEMESFERENKRLKAAIREVSEPRQLKVLKLCYLSDASRCRITSV